MSDKKRYYEGSSKGIPAYTMADFEEATQSPNTIANFARGKDKTPRKRRSDAGQKRTMGSRLGDAYGSVRSKIPFGKKKIEEPVKKRFPVDIDMLKRLGRGGMEKAQGLSAAAASRMSSGASSVRGAATGLREKAGKMSGTAMSGIKSGAGRMKESANVAISSGKTRAQAFLSKMRKQESSSK